MKNFVQQGVNLTVPAPANILSGEVVVMGDLYGVASIDASTGDALTIVTEGVFELPKVAAESFAVGDAVYYDSDTKLVTLDDTKDKIGFAVTASSVSAASVNVKLN